MRADQRQKTLAVSPQVRDRVAEYRDEHRLRDMDSAVLKLLENTES